MRGFLILNSELKTTEYSEHTEGKSVKKRRRANQINEPPDCHNRFIFRVFCVFRGSPTSFLGLLIYWHRDESWAFAFGGDVDGF